MLRKIGHIILAVILLVATMGMTISLHYCQHKIYDIGIFSKAESCCMVHAGIHATPNNGSCSYGLSSQNNCQDEALQLSTVDNFLTSVFHFDYDKYSFTLLNIINYELRELISFSHNHIHEVPFWNPPPNGTLAVLSRLQTYLL